MEQMTKKVELDLQGQEQATPPAIDSEIAPEGPVSMELPEDMEEEVRWRKIGGGTFRMAGGRIIKPNQVFLAKPSVIPEGVRRFVVQLSGEYHEPQVTKIGGGLKPPPKVVKPVYSLQVRSPGWYNILDENGKVINEAALRESQAREMLRSLEA